MKNQLLLLLYLLGGTVCAQTIRYVTPTGSGDGSSWTSASGNLLTTLQTASSGTQVWVAAGTYKTTPVSTSATDADRALSFVIPSGVQVYGGFAGTETSLNQRQLTYPLNTILSGGIGLPIADDNTYHVVLFRDVVAGTLLDGFVIREGQLNNSFVTPNGVAGCGMLNLSSTGSTSNPTIRSCDITHNGNVQVSGAGGLYSSGGLVTLTNCLITSNSGEFCGGVSSSATGTLRVQNCTFFDNSSRMPTPSGSADIRGGRLLMSNSIVWGHPLIPDPSQPTYPGRWINELSPLSSITYSYIQGRVDFAGEGTIWSTDVNPALNPRFVSTTGIAPDLHLQATSPAINTGDPDGTGLPPTDLAGNARVAGGRVDMGAFEFGSTPPASGLTLLTPAYDCSSGAFTFRTSGGDGRPIEYQAPSITSWSTNPNQLVDRESRTACDAPSVTLQARYAGDLASEVTMAWSIRTVCPACGSSVPTPPTVFAITGVRDVSCVATGPTERRLTLSPQYSGLNGRPITFSVRYESLPTTAPGPYTLRMYIDNPTITLQAQQDGSPGMATYAYSWVGACSAGSRVGVSTRTAEAGLSVRLLGNPITDESVLVDITGADGQALYLTTTDSQGRSVGNVVVSEARAHEQHWLKIGSSPGLYLLRVTTPGQSRTLKVVRR